MHESEQDAAQALRFLIEQLEFLNEADRGCPREAIAVWLHMNLDREIHRNAPWTAHARRVADLLGGIANTPDALKATLRDLLEGLWIRRMQ